MRHLARLTNALGTGFDVAEPADTATYVSVKGIPPVESPITVMWAWIVAEAREKQ